MFNRLLLNILTTVYRSDKGRGNVKQRRNFKISYLKCTVCGSIMPIPRRFGRFREKNHIKTMYCYKCDAERDFLENAEDKRYSDALPDTYELETDIPAGMDLDTSIHADSNIDIDMSTDVNADEKIVTDIQSEEDSEFYYRFTESLENL